VLIRLSIYIYKLLTPHPHFSSLHHPTHLMERCCLTCPRYCSTSSGMTRHRLRCSKYEIYLKSVMTQAREAEKASRLRRRAQEALDRDNATVSCYPALYNPSLIITCHRHRYQAILRNAATPWCRTHSGTDVIAPDPPDFWTYQARLPVSP
jgi:hypothetical protein